MPRDNAIRIEPPPSHERRTSRAGTFTQAFRALRLVTRSPESRQVPPPAPAEPSSTTQTPPGLLKKKGASEIRAPLVTGPGARVGVGTAACVGGAALTSPENLRTVRFGHHALAERLDQVGLETAERGTARTEERFVELLTRELAAAFAEEALTQKPPPLAGRKDGQVAAQPGQVRPTHTAAEHAAAAVALVQRIELFLKSNRPALALTLSGALEGRVEVERTGRGAVALRLKGRSGPPAPEDVARLREALRARGLALSSLCVA